MGSFMVLSMWSLQGSDDAPSISAETYLLLLSLTHDANTRSNQAPPDAHVIIQNVMPFHRSNYHPAH